MATRGSIGQTLCLREKEGVIAESPSDSQKGRTEEEKKVPVPGQVITSCVSGTDPCV